MTRQRWRLLRIAVAGVLGGLVLAIGIDILRSGGLDAWRAKMGQGAVRPPYEALGRVIDVDGQRRYLDCRGSGSPTVILEAGFGAGADSWGSVFDGIAATTRVCAWDRPGIGRSAKQAVHSAGDTVAELEALLAAAGERGPYIVVAHSFGGVYARLFADRHEDDGGVVALLQIDSYEPDLGMADDPTLPADLRAEIQRSLDSTAQMLAGGESLDWPATMAELAAAGPASTVVITLRQDPKGSNADRDPAEAAAMTASVLRNLARLYPNGTIEVVPGAGHFIHLDRPDIVLARVTELAERSRQPSSAPGSPDSSADPASPSDAAPAATFDAALAGAILGTWRAEPVSIPPGLVPSVDRACRENLGPEFPDGAALTLIDARGEGRLPAYYASPTGAWASCTDLVVDAHGAISAERFHVVSPGSLDDLEPLEIEFVDFTWSGEPPAPITVTYFVGTAGTGVARVEIQSPGSPAIVSSMANGWWAAWTPGPVPARWRIVAFDALGREVDGVEGGSQGQP